MADKIDEKLTELLQQNMELKETLEAMKKQEIPKIEETTASCSMENSKALSDLSFSKSKNSSYFADNNHGDGNTETEATSFIILGKDSLDAIQASSLASYVDIQQKSMSVDYNTIVSSLTANEIHQKLTELLQENTKLKETLKQNNLAMKKQLTTMVSWQDMVMKLHENHMEKFKETTNLINDLKRENLELKTKLAIQQVEDTEHSFEAIDTIPYFDNSNTFTCKTVSQELEASTSSAFEKKKYGLPNDQKYKLTMSQTEAAKRNLKAIDMISNFESNNISTYETLPQEETSTPSVSEEEKYEKSNTEQKVIKGKSLLGNDERQTPCEYNTNDEDPFATLEKSNPAIDQIHKLIYSIDKCEMNPVYWNDRDYENNRTRYNNLISELVKNFAEVINRCRTLTYCLSNMTNIFATVEETINERTFKGNLELLKKEFVKYRILAPVYNRLIHSDNDVNHLTLSFSDALKNVLEHIRDVFADYWENLNMMYIMMDETSKITNEHDNNFHNNSQEQTEVQQKLKMLAIQQSKMLKQEKELEERTHELNLQHQSLSNEKRRIHEIDILREQLVRRKNLYDGKVRALLNEKLSLMRDQKIDSTDLLKKYTQKSVECERLQHELDQIISEIDVYKNQMSVYEEDFIQERKLKESLLQEKNRLDTELQKQVNYNKQLTESLSSASNYPTVERTSPSPSREVMPPCPMCGTAFATLQRLTEHIEQSLNLD